MSEHAAQFARDAPGVEAAELLHATPAHHVYAARLTDHPDQVRIVTTSPDATSEGQTEVENQLEHWERFASHPSISTVHTRGEKPRPWLATTASGIPLSAVAPLSVENAKSVVADVAEALREATTAGHDGLPVEPEDIRVTGANSGSNSEPEPVTGAQLDWPVRLTEDVGSPYSPPELVDTESWTGERAAVFRLGALTYYAVTDQPPVSEGADESAIREQRWPSPSFVNSDVPPEFDSLVENALAYDPDERYDSPYEFKRALLFDQQPTATAAGTGGGSPSAENGAETVEDTLDEKSDAVTDAKEIDAIAGVSRRSVLGALGVGALGVTVSGGWLASTYLFHSETERFPVFRYDAANTGYAPDAVGPTDGVTEAWSFDADSQVDSSPVVADGTVLINSGDGTVYALDTADGDALWRESLDASTFISGAIGDGVAYLVDTTTDSGEVITARNLEDGSEQWQGGEPEMRARAPVLGDDRLYAFGGGTVYGLGIDGGETEWTAEGVSVTSLSGAVSDDTLYLGSFVDEDPETDTPRQDQTEGIAALDVTDGSQRWVFDMESLVSSSPAVVDGTVYAGSGDGDVVAIGADGGEERWRFETDGSVPSSPAVTDLDGGTVYVGSTDGHIYAIDRESGEERWRFETDDAVISSPAVVSETVYVGSDDEHVYAIDATDGEERWSFETGGSITSSPAVVLNTVFIGSSDGTLYALTEP